MQWQHDLDPRDVNQASQLGKSEKAPSKASLRSLVPHSQTLRLTTQLRQASRTSSAPCNANEAACVCSSDPASAASANPRSAAADVSVVVCSRSSILPA